MIGLLRAETRKLLKRRVYWVMMAILALVVGFLAFIFFILPNFVEMNELPEIRKPEAYLFGAQQVIGQNWFALIMASMLLAGEVATTAWAAALTRNSRRVLHLLAKVVVVTLASWVAMLLAIAGFSVIVALLAEGSGSLTLQQWWSIAWKTGLTQLTWVGLAFAFSAWLKSVGPAIGASIAVGFIDGIVALWRPWQRVSLSINSNALLGGLDTGGFGDIFGDPIPFARALIVVLAWALITVVAAGVGLQVRDP